jgi:hypothetical protein
VKSLEGTWRALELDRASLGLGSARGASICICCSRCGVCGKRGGVTKEDDEPKPVGADATTPGTPGPDRRPLALSGCCCLWSTLNCTKGADAECAVAYNTSEGKLEGSIVEDADVCTAGTLGKAPYCGGRAGATGEPSFLLSRGRRAF